MHPLIFSSEKCLERARKQLDINTIENDRYACLELRLCLESLAYEKMKTYRLRVPESLLSKWQPVQIISTITELEPNSQYDSQTVFFSEDAEGNPVKAIMSINQKGITAKFISKRYHKLGYYLHAPTVKNEKKKFNQKMFHEYLLKLCDELDAYVLSESCSLFANTLSLECSQCGHLTIKNTDSLQVDSIIECFKDDCRAQYCIEAIDGSKFTYRLYQRKIQCDCGKISFVPMHKIAQGHRFTCYNCGEKYQFSNTWKISKIA